MKYIVLDVGGTFIKHALMDKEGNIYQQGKLPTPMSSQVDFFNAIDVILKEYKDWEGIAMSLPGTIDNNSGFIYQGGSLKYNSMSNLKELMQERFSCPVELENDAHCAALCELWKGNLQGIENAIVLTFGTGVGGCFIFHSVPYKGSHLFAGEVSAIRTKGIDQYGRDTIWGRQGSVVKLVERICLTKGVEVSDGNTVFEWIAKGDEIAARIFQEYCEGIATQLFNFQLMLDPQRVCIGGGASCNPLFVASIVEALNKQYDTIVAPIPRLEIMPCKFHNDSNMIGALRHYIEKHA